MSVDNSMVTILCFVLLELSNLNELHLDRTLITDNGATVVRGTSVVFHCRFTLTSM